MKLTAFTDYSLRVLIYLASRPERRVTIAEVASAFGLPRNHLVKVVHFLGKAGWLANVRGKGGGLELARLPAQINVADVVRDAQGFAPVAECFDENGSDCAIAANCRLKAVLAEASTAFHAVLAQHTLADLVGQDNARPATVLFLPPREAAARKLA